MRERRSEATWPVLPAEGGSRGNGAGGISNSHRKQGEHRAYRRHRRRPAHPRLRAKQGGSGTSVGSADPLQALLTIIFGALAEVLTAWQKAAIAIVYDVGLIATMVAIEVLGHTRPINATNEARNGRYCTRRP